MGCTSIDKGRRSPLRRPFSVSVLPHDWPVRESRRPPEGNSDSLARAVRVGSGYF
ncbi:MAG: hypothetical protein MUQ67_10615 [Pirellulales bacterium]|nr:hypothetical protein [Pirellulales bacterium]